MGHGGKKSRQPLHQGHVPAPPGGPWGIPIHSSHNLSTEFVHNFSSNLLALSELFYQWDQSKSLKRGIQEAFWSDAQIALQQRLYFELGPDIRTAHLISRAEPSHHTKEAHFSRFYMGAHSFCSDPNVMSIGPVNRELWQSILFFLHYNCWSSTLISEDKTSVCQSISFSILLFLLNKFTVLFWRVFNLNQWPDSSVSAMFQGIQLLLFCFF